MSDNRKVFNQNTTIRITQDKHGGKVKFTEGDRTEMSGEAQLHFQ